MSAFIPRENIYVSTNKIYTHLVEEQLPELPRLNILSEPIFRNTAPSLAWATHRIMHINPSARLVVVPSDQAVFKEEEWRQAHAPRAGIRLHTGGRRRRVPWRFQG